MAAKKSKRVDPMKQREKRAKIVAIVGGVLFLALAAYEVPSVMKMLNQKPPPGSQFSDAGNRNPDGSIPLPSVAGGSAATTTADGELANSDVPPEAGPGQLVSFDLFPSKDPFTPQVTTPDDGSTTTPPAGSSSTGTTTTTTTTTPTTPNPLSVPGLGAPPTGTTPSGGTSNGGTSTTGTATTGTTGTTTTAAQPQVAISVNGVVSRVSTNDTFPTASPVFRLISYGKGTAQIGIVGGSYQDGDQALTLDQGKPVTLENQTTGAKYKVELLSTP